jgi:glycosyltransferase involved in cell wall biosynthesis
MQRMKKPSLAIISTYDDLCGIASYVKAIEHSLSEYFDVTILNLAVGLQNDRIAFDKHIEEISEKLTRYDVVNLHFESALFGQTGREITKRLDKIMQASKKLIFTSHRLDVGVGLNRYSLFNKLKKFQFLSLLHEIGAWYKARYITSHIIATLKKRPSCAPYHIIVHRKLDAMRLKYVFGYDTDTVLAYPLVFFVKEKLTAYQKDFDCRSWREKHGIPLDKKVIGVFGFLGQYKGHMTALKALAHLPQDFCLMIAGGQHPAAITTTNIDPTITELLSALTDPNNTTFSPSEKIQLLARVFFLGSQTTDDEMVAAVCATDYVLLPYFEVGLNASGIASMALELNKKMILSRTIAFIELDKFFPKSFESFDIGNFLELKTKVLNYDESTLENRKTTRLAYNAEGLAQHYLTLYQCMSNSV